MMTIMKMMNILLFMFFSFIYSPMQKILMLSLNIIFMMFIVHFMNKSSWLPMLFIILMIGGLMVMFIYFTSLYSEKAMKPFKLLKLLLMILTINILIKKYNLKFSMNKENFYLNYFISFNHCMIMVTLITYMLILLIINMEMISSMKTSFRALI